MVTVKRSSYVHGFRWDVYVGMKWAAAFLDKNEADEYANGKRATEAQWDLLDKKIGG